MINSILKCECLCSEKVYFFEFFEKNLKNKVLNEIQQIGVFLSRN